MQRNPGLGPEYHAGEKEGYLSLWPMAAGGSDKPAASFAVERQLVESWEQLSRDCLRAAQLVRDKHPRSSISRAYYAAFSAAVSLMWQRNGVPKSGSRETAAHQEMPAIIGKLLQSSGWRGARESQKALYHLYLDRIAADYQTRMGAVPDAATALRRAVFVMQNCGVNP